MSEEETRAIKAFNSYIYAIDTFGTIDSRCINNLYEPAKTILNLIEKYKQLYEKALGDVSKISKQCMDKDKIIQIMAEHLVGLTIYDNGEIIFADAEQAIEYFTNEVREV